MESTFGYFDGNYGVLNDVQLAIGETTCSGVFGAAALGNGGSAAFSINELSRVAMERCTSARCALGLMGQLAVDHGFYGAGQFEGSAETLLVSDTEEGWIFHILPDDTGKSAVWVAQRVPDDHVTVTMNMVGAPPLPPPRPLPAGRTNGQTDAVELNPLVDSFRASTAAQICRTSPFIAILHSSHISGTTHVNTLTLGCETKSSRSASQAQNGTDIKSKIFDAVLNGHLDRDCFGTFLMLGKCFQCFLFFVSTARE